jgi:hypothetical protein
LATIRLIEEGGRSGRDGKSSQEKGTGRAYWKYRLSHHPPGSLKGAGHCNPPPGHQLAYSWPRCYSRPIGSVSALGRTQTHPLPDFAQSCCLSAADDPSCVRSRTTSGFGISNATLRDGPKKNSSPSFQRNSGLPSSRAVPLVPMPYGPLQCRIKTWAGPSHPPTDTVQLHAKGREIPRHE